MTEVLECPTCKNTHVHQIGVSHIDERNGGGIIHFKCENHHAFDVRLHYHAGMWQISVIVLEIRAEAVPNLSEN